MRVKGLGHHYGGSEGCGYNNLSLHIIEKVKGGDAPRLAERELFWQNQLDVRKNVHGTKQLPIDPDIPWL